MRLVLEPLAFLPLMLSLEAARSSARPSGGRSRILRIVSWSLTVRFRALIPSASALRSRAAVSSAPA